MLNLSINYIKSFIDFENIYLITPTKSEVKNTRDLVVIEDREILNEDEIDFFQNTSFNKDNFFPSNWYLQQYIKLIHLERLSLEESFIIDSDTIPLKPPKVFHENKKVIPYTHEYRPQYHDFLENFIFKDSKINYKNIHIPHFCLFELKVLNLINKYLKKNNLNIFKVVKHACIYDHFFSEYELYNQFLLMHFPEEVVEIYYNGINLPRESRYMENIDTAGLFDYASFHYWKQSRFLPFY